MGEKLVGDGLAALGGRDDGACCLGCESLELFGDIGVHVAAVTILVRTETNCWNSAAAVVKRRRPLGVRR